MCIRDRFSKHDTGLTELNERRDLDAVIQCYLPKPLLLLGKKVELTAYFVIARVLPLQVYWIPGMANVANVNFDPSDFKLNDAAHLLQEHVQREAVGDQYQEHMMLWDGFEKMLLALGVLQPMKNGTWVENELTPQIAPIVHKVVQAMRPTLVPEKNRFELFRLDMLLQAPTDGHGVKVWLNEVQESPGMSLEHWAAKKVKAVMITELMDDIMMFKAKHGKFPNATQRASRATRNLFGVSGVWKDLKVDSPEVCERCKYDLMPSAKPPPKEAPKYVEPAKNLPSFMHVRTEM
eukprot:TRINITY_DN32417_c0_g1_i1.p1 TRINITY_DN32417_c0_g1~~TRINITY_DN32417_c0_g1_i1.p1  ORF type:complete len:292 (-),score=78.41 TRINITY_DN32417_c0_g1_i1:116-991(-)